MGEALCSQEGRHIPVAVSERQERTIDSTNDEYGLETHRTLTRFRVYNFRFHTPPSQNRGGGYSNDNVRSIAEQYGASRTVRDGDTRGYYSSESVEGMEVAEGLLPLASQWLAPLMG